LQGFRHGKVDAAGYALGITILGAVSAFLYLMETWRISDWRPAEVSLAVKSKLVASYEQGQ